MEIISDPSEVPRNSVHHLNLKRILYASEVMYGMNMLALWGQDKHQQIKHIKTSVFFQIIEIYFFFFLKLLSTEVNRTKQRKAATFLMLTYFDNC